MTTFAALALLALITFIVKVAFSKPAKATSTPVARKNQRVEVYLSNHGKHAFPTRYEHL